MSGGVSEWKGVEGSEWKEGSLDFWGRRCNVEGGRNGGRKEGDEMR